MERFWKLDFVRRGGMIFQQKKSFHGGWVIVRKGCYVSSLEMCHKPIEGGLREILDSVAQPYEMEVLRKVGWDLC